MGDATFKFDTTAIDRMQEITPAFKKDLLNSMGSYMLTTTRQRFRDGKSPEGSAWPATKYKADRSVRTLYGRGDLFRSIVKYFVTEDTIGVGSNLIYASVHNMGAKFVATLKQSIFLYNNVFIKAFRENAFFSWRYHITIPKREFLGISEEDSKNLASLVEMKIAMKLNNEEQKNDS